MRSIALALMMSAIPLTTGAEAQANAAAAQDTGPRLSLSLERVASLNAVFFSVDDGEDELKLRSKGVTAGGPIANPLGAPRLAFDYLSKSGLTLGTGLAFGFGDLDSNDGSDGGDIDEGGYSLVMLAPRVGYRMELADWLDLTPRAGVTLGWASIGGGEYESCDYYGNDSVSCTTEEGGSINLLGAVVNLELAAAWRLTDSFNLLTGLSYDLLVAARAKEEDGGSDSSGDSESFEDGHLSSLQLWLGLGGYL